MKRTLMCAITAAALLAPCAKAAPSAPAGTPRPNAPSGSRLLDLEEWLHQRMLKLGSPFGTFEGRPSRKNSEVPAPCDPSRTKCPIG